MCKKHWGGGSLALSLNAIVSVGVVMFLPCRLSSYRGRSSAVDWWRCYPDACWFRRNCWPLYREHQSHNGSPSWGSENKNTNVKNVTQIWLWFPSSLLHCQIICAFISLSDNMSINYFSRTEVSIKWFTNKVLRFLFSPLKVDLYLLQVGLWNRCRLRWRSERRFRTRFSRPSPPRTGPYGTSVCWGYAAH